MKTKLLITIPLLLTGLAIGCDENLPGGLQPQIGNGDPVHNGVIGGTDDNDNPTDDDSENPGQYAGGEDNTFSHPESLGGGQKDPFEVLAQRQEEGPPEIRTRLHSCQKLQYETLRRLLIVLGVDIQSNGNPDTAGELFRNGKDALGGSNYDSRKSEDLTWTNSGATKLQDIFMQAAPEIIASLPNAEHCEIDGEGVEMFNEDDTCNDDAISCIIGRPATEEHMAVCNQAVLSGTTLDKGKAIAVAALLAGAHTCQ